MAPHLLGAPLKAHKRSAYGEALVAFFGSKRAVIEYFVKNLDRLTNKSIGVMTADSVFAAIALFLSEHKSLGVLSLIALVALLLAVSLCCSNLVSTSSGLASASVTDDEILQHGLKANMSRTIRFTLALYFSGAGFLLILVQALLETFSRMTS
ncbi:MAG TPA: hypothetical protein VG407_08025 [Caulobacteraceae bacterium]|jgi:ABC-type branched-subunit amino acid transport system permease subunit|nr:hypothetical protein [Caulobacteraceae bacterium]